MGLFKGMKASRERQKAKAFYDAATSEPSNARDARKTKSILGNRCNAFIDLTFIEGAKKTTAYIEAATKARSEGKPAPPQPSTSAYKEVRTMGGKVWVYLPQNYANEIFFLGSKYQQDLIAKDRVIELAKSIADELTEALELDHPLIPLGFLVNEAEEEREEEEKPEVDLDLDDDEPEEIVD